MGRGDDINSDGEASGKLDCRLRSRDAEQRQRRDKAVSGLSWSSVRLSVSVSP